MAIRSMYNIDKNVMVAREIHHLYNENVSIIIKNGSIEIAEKIKNLPETFSLDRIGAEFALNEDIVVYSTESMPVFYEGHSEGKVTADTTWVGLFKPSQYSEPFCDGAKKYFLQHIALIPKKPYMKDEDLFNFLKRRTVDIEVDWGDGNSSAYNNLKADAYPAGDGTGGQVLYFPASPSEHIYAKTGKYNITVKFKMSYHTQWATSAIRTITVPQYFCGNFLKKKTTRFWRYSSDGKRAVSGIISIHQNALSRPVFEARTEAWEKKKGKYRNRKAEKIKTEMNFNTYTSCDGNPNYHSTTKTTKNDKQHTAQVGGAMQFLLQEGSYDIIRTSHSIYYNGEWITLSHKMIRCE